MEVAYFAIFPPTITNCTIAENNALNGGGGIDLEVFLPDHNQLHNNKKQCQIGGGIFSYISFLT